MSLANCLVIDDAVLARFGKTLDEMRAMTLGQLMEMAMSQGYDIEVGPWREAEDGVGRLRVRMANDLQIPTP